MLPTLPANSARAGALRATAMTGAPAWARVVAIPWPRPRDAPTTIVVLSDSSLIGVMALSPLFGLVWGQLAGARVGGRLPGRGVGHGVALARRSTGPTARWSSWWARRSAVRSRCWLREA